MNPHCFFSLWQFFASATHASTVTVDFRDDASIGTGINTGGLDDGASIPGVRTFTSASPELTFEVVVNDAATMSSFTGQLATLGFSAGPGLLPIDQISVVDGGSIEFSDTSTLVIFFTLNNLVETTSTGASIFFNGVSGVEFDTGLSADSNVDVGNDEAVGGVDLDAAAGSLIGGTPLTFPPVVLNANQFTVQRDAGTVNLAAVTLDFTVTPAAIPEPASLTLLVAIGLSFAGRRRRQA